MNDNLLENQLGNLQYEMNESVLNELVHNSIKQSTIKLIPIRWLSLGIASSILLFLVSVYWQTGSVDYNSILGIGDITTDDLNNYILYL